jgi:hypothetical protein
MNQNTVKLIGKIHFDVPDKTNKHKSQSSWKRVAMIMFEGEICEYYCWFIKKRYNLTLNRLLRGAHITIINDSFRDLSNNFEKSEEEVNQLWESVKNKWEGKEIEVILDVDVRTNSAEENSKGHWWLNVPNENRDEIHEIRKELQLGRPFFGIHLSVGYANSRNFEHSKYIHNMIKLNLIKD